MWHASVAARSGLYGRTICERRAYAELAGLGDSALGEWTEWNPGARVFHLRRRLTAAEAGPVGPVRDVRGTDEAVRRILALGPKVLRHVPPELLAREGGPQLEGAW